MEEQREVNEVLKPRSLGEGLYGTGAQICEEGRHVWGVSTSGCYSMRLLGVGKEAYSRNDCCCHSKEFCYPESCFSWISIETFIDICYLN